MDLKFKNLKGDKMSNPKCPKCATNEYVVMSNTFTKIGAAGGAAGITMGSSAGAAIGAGLGSFVPVIGTAIGATLGAIIGATGGVLTGGAIGSGVDKVLSKYKYNKCGAEFDGD